MNDLFLIGALSASSLATSACLIGLVWRYRWLLVKPSFMAVVFFNITVQWGAVFLGEEYIPLLPEPGHFVALIIGFPVLTTVGTLFTFRRTAQDLYETARNAGARIEGVGSNLAVVWALILIVFALYIIYIPPKASGLYAVFFSPDQATDAREAALKLLPNQLLRYAVAAVNSCVAPMAAVLGVSVCLMLWRQHRRITPLVPFLASFLFLLIVVSMSGARAPAGMLVLHVVFALFLLKGFPISPLTIACGVISVLVPPMLLSLLRNAGSFTGDSLLEHSYDIVNRTSVRSALPAFWNVEYAQLNGYFGVSAIPKLATVLGRTPIDQFNVVYMAYNNDIVTGTANTAVVFAYYGMFGMMGLPLGVVLTLATDLIVPLLRKLSLRVRIPCLSVTCVAATQFASTSYTTVFVTHGFVLAFAVGVLLDLVYARFHPETPGSRGGLGGRSRVRADLRQDQGAMARGLRRRKLT